MPLGPPRGQAERPGPVRRPEPGAGGRVRADGRVGGRKDWRADGMTDGRAGRRTDGRTSWI